MRQTECSRKMLHRFRRGLILTSRNLTSRGLATDKTRQVVTNNAITIDDSNEEVPTGDPNVFGTLSQRGKQNLIVREVERFHPDDKDSYDKEEYDLKPRKNAYYYKYEIAKYARQGARGLKRALELFKEMKSEAHLTPDHQNFACLVYGCSKAGYAKKAFEIYEEWLKYYKKPSNSGINCLLNVCAECQFPEYGLERLEWFLTELKVRFNHDLNLIQYNTAIKAYGKLGRLDEASKLVQQMIDQGIQPDVNTFNSLLIGCASNKDSGSALALRVFKRLKMYDIKPDTVTYRLLLRCIRDCGLGSNELIKDTLRELPAMTSLEQRLEYRKRMPKNEKKFRQNFEWTPLLTDLGKSLATAVRQPTSEGNRKKGEIIRTSETSQTEASNTTTSDFKGQGTISIANSEMTDATQHQIRDISLVSQNDHISLPNVLSDDHLDLMSRIEGLQVDKLRTRYDRLVLFGGLHGFVEAMLRDGCRPDVKTFSLILLCIRPKKEHLLDLFKLGETLKMKRDVDFYDQLIWCICREHRDTNRLDLALEFVERMNSDNLRPTINTFEALARGCDTWKQARQMMDDMERSGLVVSNPMIEGYFNSALARRNYHFLTMLLHLSRKKQFTPTTRCIERLEVLRIETNNLIARQEKGKISKVLNDKLVGIYDEFSKELKQFLGEIQLRQEIHPWEQYHVPSESKKDGFFRFVRHLNAMERLKRETLRNGKGHLGNVAYKAEKLMQQAELAP